MNSHCRGWRRALNLVGVALVVCASGGTARADTTQSDATNPTGAKENGIGGQVDPFYGSFRQNYPLVVPSFHGIEPKLALTYGSGGANGFAGTGWGLAGFDLIERVGPGKGAPKYDASDVFLLDGQELVPCAPGSVSPSCTTGGTHSTKIENYARVSYSTATNRWTIWQKNGTKATFAPALSSTTGVFRWSISNVVDTSGNRVDYAYWADQNYNSYPSTVTYNKTAVTLYWQPRTDVIQFAGGGDEALHATRYILKTVDVKVDGLSQPRVRAYDLRYTTSPTTGRSLLSSVQLHGRDAGVLADGTIVPATSAPASTFAYTATGGAFTWPTSWATSQGGMPGTWATGDFNGDGKTDFVQYFSDTGKKVSADVHLSTGTNFAWKRWLTQLGGYVGTVTTGDFDGDGKTDLAHYWNDAGAWSNNVYLSTGTSFANPVRWANQQGGVPGTWVTGDFNGDGKTDFAQWWPDADQQLNMDVHLSTGTSFGMKRWATHLGGFLGAVTTGDFNGDGKTDFAHAWSDAGFWSVNVYLSTGSSFVLQRWATQQDRYRVSGGANWTTGDFNGDGKTDFVQYWNDGNTWSADAHLSTGSGFVVQRWATQQGEYVTTNAAGGRPLPGAWLTGDFNGDGKTDFAEYWKQYGNFMANVHLSTGAAFTWQGTWSANQDVYRDPSTPASWMTGDFNGDGKTDFAQYWSDAGNWNANVQLSSGVQTDLLNNATNGLGGTTSVSYVPASAWPNTNNPGVFPTVATIKTSDGRGGSSKIAYSYSGGLVDRLGAGFLGFHYVKEVLPTIGSETAGPYHELWFKQDYGSVSKPERVDQRDGQGRLLASRIYEYVTNGVTIPYTSLMSAEWQFDYDGDGPACATCSGAAGKRTMSSYLYDAYANVVQRYAYRDYDAPGDELIETYTIVPNTTDFIVDRIGVTESYASTSDAQPLTRTIFQYDGAATWNQPPSRGLPTRLARWLNGSPESYAITTAAYDAWGNLTSSTDEMLATTAVAYDSIYHLFPTQVTNALGQTQTFVVDPGCGGVSQTTDLNGQATSYQHDPLCRLTRTNRPLGDFEIRSYAAVGNPNAQYVQVERPPANGSGNVWSREYLDGLGRNYMIRSKGPANNQDTVNRDVSFDARGNVSSEARPYFGGAAVYRTAMTYDGLDRLTSRALPDGASETIAYRAWSETRKDAGGRLVTTTFDALGIRSRAESIGNEPVTTTYTRDPQGHLVRLDDAAGNTWTWAYDSLGRKTAADDPDFGASTYAYDAKSRLTEQTDAKGQLITATYDALGRIVEKESGTSIASMNYDEVRDGYSNVGRLTTLADAAGTRTSNYDAAGHLVDETRTIDGTRYSRTLRYDAAGRPLGITYPDGDAVGTTSAPLAYDDAGRLRAIPGIIDNLGYDASGGVLSQENHNGTVTHRSYSVTRGWVTGIATSGPGATIQNLTYARNAAGLVTQTTSAKPGESWSYAYDELYRLEEAQNTSDASSTEAFTYDLVGNITWSTRRGAYTYPAPGLERPHAATDVGGHHYDYDDDGNLNSGPDYDVAWNAYNVPTRINGSTYSYEGGSTIRLAQHADSGVAHYPFGDDYEVRGNVTTKYITLAGQQVAKRVGIDTYWLHTDELGSVQAITDATGSEVQRFTYQPFGDRRSTSTTHAESKGWVGERQDETGLFYLHARYYDPKLGRFISPDPSSPERPEVGTNRYAYSLNNPVNATDKGGLEGIPTFPVFVNGCDVYWCIGSGIPPWANHPDYFPGNPSPNQAFQPNIGGSPGAPGGGPSAPDKDKDKDKDKDPDKDKDKDKNPDKDKDKDKKPIGCRIAPYGYLECGPGIVSPTLPEARFVDGCRVVYSGLLGSSSKVIGGAASLGVGIEKVGTVAAAGTLSAGALISIGGLGIGIGVYEAYSAARLDCSK